MAAAGLLRAAWCSSATAGAVASAVEAQATATVADISSTAAIEVAAGALSRAFAGAEVEGPS